MGDMFAKEPANGTGPSVFASLDSIPTAGKPLGNHGRNELSDPAALVVSDHGESLPLSPPPVLPNPVSGSDAVLLLRKLRERVWIRVGRRAVRRREDRRWRILRAPHWRREVERRASRVQGARQTRRWKRPL